MFGFGRNAKEALYGVLIDISSGSVGVAIVELNPHHNTPAILFQHRTLMRASGRDHTPQEKLRLIQEALFAACLIVSKDGLQKLRDHAPKAFPNRIFVTCSSPWSHVLARNVQYKQDESFKITDEILQDLISSAESEIESNASASELSGHKGFTIVERATVDVRINGYQVTHPHGLKGTEVSLSHITGLIPSDILETVYDVRDKLFPKSEIRAHTSMLVTFCVMRDIFLHESTFALANVFDDTIEIGIVEHGILHSTVHIPFGSTSLIRSIMKGSGKPFGDVQSLLLSYAEGRLAVPVITEVEEYLRAYKDAIVKEFAKLRLPQIMVITAHYPLEGFFQKTIHEALPALTNGPYKIISTNRTLIENISGSESTDVYIAISAAFFHKLHGCGEINAT